MKRYFVLALTLVVVLSACSAVTPMPSTDQIVSEIYTQGAQTLVARMSTPTSSPTPLPAPTLTPTPTSTLIPPTAAPTAVPLNVQIKPHAVYVSWEPKARVRVDYSLCNSATYYEDVTVPDGTVFSPNESFEKVWTIQNTGYCAWKPNYMVKFYEGESMSGVDTEIGRMVWSGRDAKISLELTAPAVAGTYTGYWILADEYGTAFGMPFYVQIVVENE